MSPQQHERNKALSERHANCPAATNTSNPRVKRSVSYGSVKIREYERVIGDNPGCSSGVPIGIGWNYQVTEETNIDDVQHQKKDYLPAVPLTSEERETVLKRWNYSRSEIDESQHEVSRIQSQRDKSNASLMRYQRFKQRALDLGDSFKTTIQRLNPLRARNPKVSAATTFEVDIAKYKSSV